MYTDRKIFIQINHCKMQVAITWLQIDKNKIFSFLEFFFFNLVTVQKSKDLAIISNFFKDRFRKR